MLFSENPRSHYAHSQIREVVCQLRFPTILSINTQEPAEFQELIRDQFPQYLRRQETTPPQLVRLPDGKMEVRQAPPTANYNFISADNRWKLNLTKDFIALSTLTYPGWEEFARHLDKPLAAFIEHYHPAYFQRVGLRYVNIFSRAALGLQDVKWAQLFAPAYTAAFQEPDVNEENFLNCATDLNFRLDSSCQAKIHAGPAHLKSANPNQPADPETKFIFDMDLTMGGNTPCNFAAPALETLHGHGTRLFEGAITDTLREALDGE